jgi:hypothetical protein
MIDEYLMNFKVIEVDIPIVGVVLPVYNGKICPEPLILFKNKRYQVGTLYDDGITINPGQFVQKCPNRIVVLRYINNQNLGLSKR